jgi:hypothetical protein
VRPLFCWLFVACATPEAGPVDAGPSASAAPAFDIDGFCDKALGVGRPCEGDDELLEGNKIGLCTTTLREAGVLLDPALAPACLAAVEAGKPLPDIRTLELLVARFPACRKLFEKVDALAKVAPASEGTTAAGQACNETAACARGLYCDGTDPKKRACVAKKKAGEACGASDECLGRCSGQAGKRCVAYCGSG